ncbi:hypothetical protein GPALN_014679 [Globodera pallida]|nr:hypothetical protein GPALN_014679 [Globodera pallida]
MATNPQGTHSVTQNYMLMCTANEVVIFEIGPYTYSFNNADALQLFQSSDQLFFQPLPEYANIGYQSSSPYKSAYRQCQFPTMHQQMSPPSLSGHRQPPMTSSTSFSALVRPFLGGQSAKSHEGRKDVASCRPCTSSSASSLLAAAASTQLGQIVRRLDAAHPLRVPLIVGRAGGVQSGQAHSTGSLDRRLRRVPTTTTMKLASSTTSATPPAFHQLPPPPLPRTTAIEELVERDQLLVTVSDRCDNGIIM